MVPKFAPDWFPNCVPDWVGDSGGGWAPGGDCAQLIPSATINKNASTNRRTIVELLWPQEAVELRSAWTLRLRSGQAPEGARPHAILIRTGFVGFISIIFRNCIFTGCSQLLLESAL